MFYVDIPTKDCVGNDDGAWHPLRTFDTKADAVEWIREHLGWCDDNGNICLISGGESFKDEDVLGQPCQECGNTETPLHTNGVCGNCFAPDREES